VFKVNCLSPDFDLRGSISLVKIDLFFAKYSKRYICSVEIWSIFKTALQPLRLGGDSCLCFWFQ
jgi:hypothetical protein